MSGVPAAARIPGAILLVAGLAIGAEATTFDVYFLTDPVGPKALPLLVAVLLVAAGAHATWRPPPPSAWPDRAVALRLVGAVAAFALYAVGLDLLGFVLATTLVVGALSLLYGAPPKRGLGSALALSVALWLLFVQLLALPLPIGRLWMR